MASTLSKMEISITKQVRAKRDAMTFMMVNDVKFYTVQQLQEELTDFARFLPSTTWGGGYHRYIPLVLSQDKMRIVANNNQLDFSRIDKPNIVNPEITTDTKYRDLLKLQEEKLALWESFVYQKFVGQVGVETIVTSVDEKYIKPLHQKYMGYNKRTILEMLAQLGTCFTITNTEDIKMRNYFEPPWSNTPNAHVKTFATQIDERQIE